MKRISILLLSIMCANIVFGQSGKQKVAVWVTGSNADIVMVVADQLTSAISVNNTYAAVERSADFLKLVSQEAGYQKSGNVDDKEIARLGKQLGVKLVCLAKISSVAGTNYVSARIVNVETALIVSSANINNKFETIEAIVGSCETLAANLLGVKSKTEIAKEQQARENQRQEAEKIRQEKERIQQEKEQFIKREKERGYTLIGGTLYVQTSLAANSVVYKRAVQVCASSRVGGFSDWRLPTQGEGKRISSKKNEIPGLIESSYIYSGTWTSTQIDRGERATIGGYGSCNEKVEAGVICVRGR